LIKESDSRLTFAVGLARSAGAKALEYFSAVGDLVIEQKGVQDLVSNADRDVEIHIREHIAQHYPDDGIVGEEYENVEGTSGYVWVIDPIDGTANFVRGLPAWCVVLACVHDDAVKVGVIYEPCNGEMFSCAAGAGASLNGRKIKVATTSGLDDGSVGVGMNNRTDTDLVVRVIGALLARGGIFYRNASGALMLAYVASGRLIGYTETHMNAWDCLAGQLLVAEAGGRVEKQSADAMVARGGRVVAATPLVFDELVALSDEAYGP